MTALIAISATTAVLLISIFIGKSNLNRRAGK